MEAWDYRIRAYASPNKGGHLLLETVHRGEASRDVELSAYRERMCRGEVGRVEVIDLREGSTRHVANAIDW